MQHLAVGMAQAQRQKLKFTPQLRQSVKLLTLPIADLQLKVQEALEEFPALEILKEKEMLSIETLIADQSRSDKDPFEDSSDPGFTDNFSYENNYNSDKIDSKQNFIEGALSREETLQEHLLWQLRIQPLPEDEITIGTLIIENLDSKGFLIEPLDTILDNKQLQKLPLILPIIQGFDPIGTAVHNFEESLIVQAEIRGDAPENFNKIIIESLEELEKGHLTKIKKQHNISEEEILELIEYLRILTPFPGALFSKEKVDYVAPELSITKDGEILKISINKEEIPELQISEELKALQKQEEKNQEVKTFVEQQIRDANNFIGALDYRFSTLEKVARELVITQKEFFEKGPKFLKPLRLKDMAERINVHESTISRITTSKYIHTDWGIYSLKIFFSSAISKNGKTQTISKNSIKEIIKELIESSEKRLSDQKISDLLKEKGISIARRTVAKYRGELDIASSFDRGNI